jgi:hypothetical protein
MTAQEVRAQSATTAALTCHGNHMQKDIPLLTIVRTAQRN